jgi:peptidoglycan-associated lipoprotein
MGFGRWEFATALAVGACALSGCASGPRTTVVLLPDEDGHVGAVSVSAGEGSQVIDQAFSGVIVQGRKTAPSVEKPVGEAAVASSYAPLLKAQPPKPASFILHFILDSTEMTEESKAMIPQVLAAARTRSPTEVTVFGHADATGTQQRNYELSIRRARLVADLLMKTDAAIEHVDVEGFGDTVPLPGSSARGADPRNRRVEVLIL